MNFAHCLREHQNDLVIDGPRNNKGLAEGDQKNLQQALVDLGGGEGEELLETLMEQRQAQSLSWFARSMVGMDREAAKAAFSTFLTDATPHPKQIRFVEMIIDQLRARRVMEASALYEPPFTRLHAGGPDELFGGRGAMVEGVFSALNRLCRSDAAG